MTTEKLPQPPTKSALESINSGQVTMHSRSRLLARSSIQILGTTTLLLLTVYLLSYVLFQAKSSGAIHLTAFGSEGVLDLLLSLPKIILLLTLLLFIILIWTYEHYPIAYRRPLVISLLGVAILVCTSAGLVYKTGLHGYLTTIEKPGWKAFGFKTMYGNPQNRPLHNSRIGQVTELGPEVFFLLSTDGQTYLVYTPTLKSRPQDPLGVADWIIVKGHIEDQQIQAKNIKLLPAFR